MGVSLRTVWLFALAVALLVTLGPPEGGHHGVAAAQDRPGRTLDVYVIDVEGGNATLFVSPATREFSMEKARKLRNTWPSAFRNVPVDLDA